MTLCHCLLLCSDMCPNVYALCVFVPGVQVGEGEFGTVYKAQYLGTTVAVKVLKDDNAVAIGDFRCVLTEVWRCDRKGCGV